MVFIKPTEGFPGNHVYASDSLWAFDHNGWNKEEDLIKATEKAYKTRYPGWHYQRIVIEPGITALEDFCKANNHRLPWQFAYLPWERAHKYIAGFDAKPPTA